MIEINRNPSRTELYWFGLVPVMFFGLVGEIALRRTHSVRFAAILWIVSAVLTAIYFVVPAVRRPVYVGWMYLTYPFGWILSHLLILALFYLVITPIGLLMRLFSRDPLTRTFEPNRQSYWVEHDPAGGGMDRYFRQS